MPRVYKRNCNNCGEYYKGEGKFFCSVSCSRIGQKRHGRPKGMDAWNKGLTKHADERVNYNRPTKFKKGSPGPWLGKKRSKETIEKMRKGKLGYKASKETRKKQSESLKGDKCYRWKRGISPRNVKIRNCLEYRQWRSDIFTRDDFTCQDCGIRGGVLNAHHIKKFCKIMEDNNIRSFQQALECEELWNINNGVTLCLDCHRKTKHVQYTT